MQTPVRVPAYPGVVTEALATLPAGANVTTTVAGPIGSPACRQVFRRGPTPSMAAFAAFALNPGSARFAAAAGPLGESPVLDRPTVLDGPFEEPDERFVDGSVDGALVVGRGMARDGAGAEMVVGL